MKIIDKIIVSPTPPPSKNAAWFDGEEIKILNQGKWESVGGGGLATSMVNITYEELVKLRDEGNLIPGTKYRMTDYETMTSKAGSQSAGHPFDLVLTALDNKTLDEKCSAIWSERDTDGYFANSNLPAWDVRYCLDNDKSKFDWASKAGSYLSVDDGEGVLTGVLNGTYEFEGSTYHKWEVNDAFDVPGLTVYLLTTTESLNIGDEVMLYDPEYNESWPVNVVALTQATDGKGVIYRLIDEKRNDVPYDFKNIQFVRKITDGALDLENGTDTFCYTFSNFSSGVLLDESFETAASNVFNTGCWDNVFLGNDCYSNAFGDNCYSNTFGDDCYSNTFGNRCQKNTFRDRCHSNSFEYNCYSNTFGDDCYSNTFGDGCQKNTFGDNCHSNSFGNSYLSNTFGDDCYSNSFGVNCNSTSFGNKCFNNVFGYDCDSNTFDEGCCYNTFGDGCSYNTFGTAELPAVNIKHYKVDCVSRTEIAATASRNFITYVTKNSNGDVVQYTIDDILNA